MREYTKKLENSYAFIAELWGVLESLKVVASKHIRYLELQVDSKVVVNNISKE